MSVDHDAATNFVANEHIDHTAVSISAGTGLSGGGDISANRSLALSHLGIESLADPNADRIMFWDDSAGATAWLTAGSGLSISGTTITATGGSDTFTTIQSDGVAVSTAAPTLDFDSGDFTLTESPTDDFDVTINDGGIDHDATTNFVANEHVDHTSVSISAGTGLSGGGDISSSRSLALSHLGLESLTDPNDDRIAFWDDSAGAFGWLDAGSGVTISTTTISVDHDAATNFVANEHIDWTSTSESLSTSGTITNSVLTAGSVLYAGTGGLISDDLNEFSWDATNKRLGIGTSSPVAGAFHLFYGAGAGTDPSWDAAKDTMIIEGDDDPSIQIFSTAADFGVLGFADPGGRNQGYVAYNHANDGIYIGAGGTRVATFFNQHMVCGNKTTRVNTHSVAEFAKAPALDGSDAVTLTLRQTRNAGSWVAGNLVHSIDFYSDDASGAGVGTKARIGTTHYGTSGAGLGLTFSVDSGSGLTEVFRYDKDARFQVATSAQTGQGKFNVFCSSASQRVMYGKMAASPTNDAIELENSSGTDIFNVSNTGDVSVRGVEVSQKVLNFHPFGSGTAVSTGDGTVGFPITSDITGWEITNVLCTVHDKGVTNTTDVQIRRRRAGVDADVLSTKVTIGDEFYAEDGVVNAANDDLQTGDVLYVDVDAVHSGTAPNGLSVAVTIKAAA